MTDRPFLTTDRFELWIPTKDNLAGLCALHADEETRRFLGPASSPQPKEQFPRLMRHIGVWASYGYGMAYVRPKGARDLIGNCGVFHSVRGFGLELGMDDVPEAGWTVRRDWWGRGVAGEVMAAILPWFDRVHGGQRIACMIDQDNAASQRVAVRLGFAPYASHRDGEVELQLYERLPVSG